MTPSSAGAPAFALKTMSLSISQPSRRAKSVAVFSKELALALPLQSKPIRSRFSEVSLGAGRLFCVGFCCWIYQLHDSLLNSPYGTHRNFSQQSIQTPIASLCIKDARVRLHEGIKDECPPASPPPTKSKMSSELNPRWQSSASCKAYSRELNLPIRRSLSSLRRACRNKNSFASVLPKPLFDTISACSGERITTLCPMLMQPQFAIASATVSSMASALRPP